MKQLTEKEAIAFYENKLYDHLTTSQKAFFQMEQERLCMPFGVFQEAVQEVVGRPVWTHEFAKPDLLRKEMRGERKAPNFQEILDMIPKGKVIKKEKK